MNVVFFYVSIQQHMCGFVFLGSAKVAGWSV